MAEAEKKPEKTHNMIMLAIIRQDGDPLLCPIMSAAVLVGSATSKLTGAVQQIYGEALPVACAGPVCAIYDRGRKQCSLLAAPPAGDLPAWPAP